MALPLQIGPKNGQSVVSRESKVVDALGRRTSTYWPFLHIPCAELGLGIRVRVRVR